MASLATKQGGRSGGGESETAETPAKHPPAKRKRRRWLAAAVSAVAVAAVLLLLAPWIVAHTALLGWILAAATADLDGTVTVQSASLGWFSPIVAEGIEIRDAQQRPVFQATTLTGERSLAAILWNTSRLGAFRLERPKLDVVMRGNGSNIEDVLAAYLAPSEEPTPAIGLTLGVVDGHVSLIDQGGGRTWEIEKLQVALTTSADVAGAIDLETSGTVADPQRPGRFMLRLSMRPAAEEDASYQPSTGTGEVAFETDAVPLEACHALLARFSPQTRLAGRLSSNVETRWGGAETAGPLTIQADVTADGLRLAAAPLGTDELALRRLVANCRLAWHDDRIEIAESSLDCDLGNASVQGTLELGDGESLSMLTSVLGQTYQTNGRLDLVRLAEMLPGTLRIREGAEITSGQVQWSLGSRPEPQGMVWQGQIEAKGLEAVYGGRPLAWEKPIVLTMALRESPQGPVVENLRCESDFLNVHAAGTPDQLGASINFDLRQLADQLGQFVDLGRMQLGGDGWAHLNWKRSPQQEFAADAELQLRDFRFTLPGGEPWIEETLVVSLLANGRTDLGDDMRLDHAAVNMQTATDRLDAQLLRPVADFRAASWPLEVTMSGQLQRWLPRLAVWTDVSGLAVAGTYQLAAQVTGSAQQVAIQQAKLDVGQLQWRSPWLNLDEPNVKLECSGQWDGKLRRVELKPVTITSSGLALEASQLLVAMSEKDSLQMTGRLKYRADLARLQQWMAEPGTRPSWQMAGELAGTAELAQAAGPADLKLEADLNSLVVAFASGERFEQSRVQLAAVGQYEHASGVLRLDRARLASDALAGNVAGNIHAAGDLTSADLRGEIEYDLEKLAVLLRPYLGPSVSIAGSGKRPAWYRGSLSPSVAEAEAAMAWQRLDVYGFPVGPGELKLHLADGVAAAEPMKLALSQGELLLTPRLRLAPVPAELTLPAGPLIRQVQITPSMCDSALKYIAPVLADVTTAEGRFSIDLEGCRVPLADPAQGELAGKLTVHSVQVGPGPLIRELAVLLRRESPARLRRESTVDFRMVDGRVYHQGLELTFPDLTIRTFGSVGLDQSLALVAEMPIPPKWIGNNVLGSALKDQTIRLPIGGTLDRPQIDHRTLEQLNRQFIQKATQNLLENEVGRQLERLFGQ
ncbi:MAG: hypothetical protein JXB62_06155 [Pirellulales bacterium]|nr:hypothetical protein [Pirellulales bacterium]